MHATYSHRRVLCRFLVKLNLESIPFDLKSGAWRLMIRDQQQTFEVAVVPNEYAFMALMVHLMQDPFNPDNPIDNTQVTAKLYLWCRRVSERLLQVYLQDKPEQMQDW